VTAGLIHFIGGFVTSPRPTVAVSAGIHTPVIPVPHCYLTPASWPHSLITVSIRLRAVHDTNIRWSSSFDARAHMIKHSANMTL